MSRLAAVALLFAAALGCGESRYDTAKSPQEKPPAPSKQAEPATEELAADAEPASEEPAKVLTEAKVGVGEKGSGYGGKGFVTTTVSSFFRAQERLAFAQVEHHLKTYEALNGGPPKTQEEFMQEVIQANGIKLPELPEGHRYVYLVDKKQLMIEQPAP